MGDVTIKTMVGPMFAAFDTDATDTSFPSVLNRLGPPALGAGVFALGVGGTVIANAIRGVIIGTGQDDAVITGMRVYGWYPARKLGRTNATLKDLWVNILLAEFAAVLSSKTGIAGTDFGTTYFFADTITQVTGNANVSNEIISPTGNENAHFILDMKGAHYGQITFDLGANATGGNCLVGLQ